MDENKGLELTEENVDTVLDEIRCGGGGGGGGGVGSGGRGRLRYVGWG